MLNKKILIILFLIQTIKPTDFWIGSSLQKPITNQIDLLLYQEFDTKEFINDLYFYLIDINPIFKIQKHLSITPSLRIATLKQTSSDNKLTGPWLYETSPMLSINHEINIKQFTLSSKATTMYRILQKRENRGVFREKLSISYLLKSKNNIFISNDFGYNYNGFHQIDDNKFSIGFNLNLNKNFNIKIYYLRNNYKDNIKKWPGINVLGLSFDVML